MPTRSFFQDFNSRLEDVLWSLWSEMGIPGWERRRRDQWIDPEALILFTATLDPIDPRLRDEALGWCTRNQRYLSVARVRRLLACFHGVNGARYQPQLGRFLSTVFSMKILKSDVKSSPHSFRTRKTSAQPVLTRASLLSLRLRTLLGVTANAEISRIFIARPNAALTAADFVNDDVGYTKRAVRDAREDMRAGGFVEVHETGNRKAYEFVGYERFLDLLDLPELLFPNWRALFVVLRGLLDLNQSMEHFRSATRHLEARRVFTSMAPEIRAAGLKQPAPRPGSEFVDVAEDWMNDVLTSLSRGISA